MKKKIAIVSKKMITGGVERALIAMLKHIDYNAVDIDLYLMEMGGELLDELPDSVNVHEIPRIETFKEAIQHPIYFVKKILNKIRLNNTKLPYVEQCRFASDMLLPIIKQYDVAIAYHAPNTVPVFYVIDSLNARKKILWLHGDLHTNAGNNPIAHFYHEKYDQIVAVAKYVETSYLFYHSTQSSKVSTLYNYIDTAGIHRKAESDNVFNDCFSGTRIVSVGRLEYQKGFDIAIEACHKLIARGYSIRWYVCGEGTQRQQLEKLIYQYNLQKAFFLLGNIPNPYPYMKNCNLYVQTSRFEGYCTTTNEAKILGSPVITTRVSGAEEQFVNAISGWIVDINADSISERIAWCIEQKNEIEELRMRLAKLATLQNSSSFDLTSFLTR